MRDFKVRIVSKSLINDARNETRTHTPLPELGPEPSASTNSAIRAIGQNFNFLVMILSMTKQSSTLLTCVSINSNIAGVEEECARSSAIEKCILWLRVPARRYL